MASSKKKRAAKVRAISMPTVISAPTEAPAPPKGKTAEWYRWKMRMPRNRPMGAA